MKHTAYIAAAALAVLFFGVGCSLGQKFVARQPTAPVVGANRDEHGCIGSAGYSWCAIKEKCLRPWEEACDGLKATAINYLASLDDQNKYCNGDDMDPEGYRKSITDKRTKVVEKADMTLAQRVVETLKAAAGDRCQEFLTSGDIKVENGIVTMPAVDGWAGITIATCYCRPLIEVNALSVPGIGKVDWSRTYGE